MLSRAVPIASSGKANSWAALSNLICSVYKTVLGDRQAIGDISFALLELQRKQIPAPSTQNLAAVADARKANADLDAKQEEVTAQRDANMAEIAAEMEHALLQISEIQQSPGGVTADQLNSLKGFIACLNFHEQENAGWIAGLQSEVQHLGTAPTPNVHRTSLAIPKIAGRQLPRSFRPPAFK